MVGERPKTCRSIYSALYVYSLCQKLTQSYAIRHDWKEITTDGFEKIPAKKWMIYLNYMQFYSENSFESIASKVI